ncbi:hypothetical protein DEO72_LG5g1750 [Vigna unguiculata]|uniref:Uncharacterized protein n=1 Tax=Vigna unguiculata TaxID=3917 RepID=A0A4D6M0R5_VIGUN|nr:hypothetical protein DEO72_LG5g1750 [Vigna unguiculata]
MHVFPLKSENHVVASVAAIFVAPASSCRLLRASSLAPSSSRHLRPTISVVPSLSALSSLLHLGLTVFVFPSPSCHLHRSLYVSLFRSESVTP